MEVTALLQVEKKQTLERMVGALRSHCPISRHELHCAVCIRVFSLCLEMWLHMCSGSRLSAYVWLLQICPSASLLFLIRKTVNCFDNCSLAHTCLSAYVLFN